VYSSTSVDVIIDDDSAREFTPTTRDVSVPEMHTPEVSLNIFRAMTMAGISIILAVSPMTAISDPWLQERDQRDAAITISVYRDIIGRPISLSEAKRIARNILVDAERERLQIAENEASKGIQWMDES